MLRPPFAKFALMLAAVFALGVASLAFAQDHAPAPVYRCREANGAVTYQDYACKGGQIVDIKPDAADPAAIKRLRRAQAEFDRAAAQRKGAEAATTRREQPAPRREPRPASSESDGDARPAS